MNFRESVEAKYKLTAKPKPRDIKKSLKLSMVKIPHRFPDMFEDEGDAPSMEKISAKIDGKEVGWAEVGYHPGEDNYVVFSVQVKPAFRRNGIATAMYDFFEKKYKEVLHPFPGGHSDDAKEFWSNRISKNRSKYPHYDNWGS